MSIAEASAVGARSTADHLQRAGELLQRRKLTEALTAYCSAEKHGADGDACSGGRWLAHMLNGKFAEAWHESDSIRARGAEDPHRFWLGEDISSRRVMVRCLHGLGDAVQMLRFIPALRARCSHVTVEVPPRMVELAHCFSGVDDVITWGDGAPDAPPKWDVQIEIMELPYFFRIDAADLPLARDYLRPPVGAAEVADRIADGCSEPRVGLVWSASEWDGSRALPMDCLARITQIDGINFWNLQGGEKHRESVGHPALTGVHDAAVLGEGLAALAAVVASLDLVITVDTLAAHLAGAMGRPCWLLLQHAADWRWMHGRSDTPWYPSLRLWRQPVQDDWWSLTTQVCDALEKWKASA